MSDNISEGQKAAECVFRIAGNAATKYEFELLLDVIKEIESTFPKPRGEDDTLVYQRIRRKIVELMNRRVTRSVDGAS